MKTYLVTGGAGFIGSGFVRYILKKRKAARVINLDKLTYAGNPDNVKTVADDPRYSFVRGDICDRKRVRAIFERDRIDYLVNFAAETHVDRSIGQAGSFLRTDVTGTFVLLEAAREFGVKRFIQISTDEVYGSTETGSFSEDSPLQPRNPYSASKAGADRLAYSYFTTYGLPVIVTRASNNYGPFQHPEKLIPLFVSNALEDRPLPLYGDGRNVRDWLFVDDHCAAVDFLAENGENGGLYNIGGGNEMCNIDITRRILSLLGKPESLISFVKDRQGHDRRYSLDTKRLRALGWAPRTDFAAGLERTVEWYVENRDWWRKIKKKAAYKRYYDRQYSKR